MIETIAIIVIAFCMICTCYHIGVLRGNRAPIYHAAMALIFWVALCTTIIVWMVIIK